jgi:hypothetical protein
MKYSAIVAHRITVKGKVITVPKVNTRSYYMGVMTTTAAKPQIAAQMARQITRQLP